MATRIPVGIRHKQVLGFKTYIQEQKDNGYKVPKAVQRYVKDTLTKERFFDKAFAEK